MIEWRLSFVVAALLAATTAWTGPLPRLAVSLPAGLPVAEAARAVKACGRTAPQLVLPVVTARLGDGFQAPMASAADPLPAGTLVHLSVEVGPFSSAGREREVAIDRQSAEVIRVLALDRDGVAGLVVDTASADIDDLRQFVVASLAVKARAARPGLEVVIAAKAGRLPPRLLAYVDAVTLPLDSLVGEPGASLAASMGGHPIVARAASAPSDSPVAGGTAVAAALVAEGARAASVIWIDVAGPAALRGACGALSTLSSALDGALEMTAPERAPAAILVDGGPAPASVAFVDSRSADLAFLVRAGAAGHGPRALTLTAPPGTKPPQISCVDALDGRSMPAARDALPGCRTDAEFVLFRATVPGGSDRLFESVRVTGRKSLRVEEIIARWQAARELERAGLDSYSVDCFLSLHFESSGAQAGFDVALELRQFWDRGGTNDWVQTAFRVNGVKLRRGQEFPLPQLEPDKVVTKPLELRLDDKYTYDLLGTDTVDGRLCYVVAIRPGASSEALYSGKVWIDGLDFRQARLYLEQRTSGGNVASHIETQSFGRVKDAAGHEFTLVRAIDAQDAVNLAGRSITLEKRYRFGEYAINAAGFTERLSAARSGDDPMFRDTDEGLRTLEKQGTERVVNPTVSKQLRAVVGGLLYDPSRAFPIPLAGVSWADFDFRKSGNQLTAFFAGPIFVANLSRQVNARFRWGVDLSLNALPNTSNVYDGSREVTGERVLDTEQFVGALFAWQVSPALELSTQIDLFHDWFRAADTTMDGYVLPSSGVTLSVFGEAKYTRKGLKLVGTVERGQRAAWHAFGPPGSLASTPPGWTRYSVDVSQHLYAGKLTRGGVSAAYYTGQDLDRFSRWTSSFVRRLSINGLPSGVDSFDDVASVGGYYGFNVMDAAKLQGAYTHAWTRNKDEGNRLRQFDGLNFSVGIAGPFGTFVQGSASVALRGDLDRYRSRWGTYLVFLKPWKK